jgi:hypothetical protein
MEVKIYYAKRKGPLMGVKKKTKQQDDTTPYLQYVRKQTFIKKLPYK